MHRRCIATISRGLRSTGNVFTRFVSHTPRTTARIVQRRFLVHHTKSSSRVFRRWPLFLIVVPSGVFLKWALADSSPESPPVYKERRSGIPFPVQHPINGQVLVGAGARTVFFFKVTTYAVALYIEPQAFHLLSHFAGIDGTKLAADPAFYEAVLRGSFRKTIRIIAPRFTKAQHLSDGLVRSITTRLQQLGKVEEQQAIVAKFKEAFRDLPANVPMDFIWDSNDTLVVAIDGKQVGRIENAPLLCWALFDVYLGTEAKAPEAKTDFAIGMARLLSSSVNGTQRAQ